MKETIKEQIKEISFQNKGYISTSEIDSKGINRYYISELEKLGILSRVKTGLYKWADYDFQYNFELVDVFKLYLKECYV